jgi:hypothetical protein
LNDENIRVAAVCCFNAALEVFQHGRHDGPVCRHDNRERFVALCLHGLKNERETCKNYQE